MVLNTLPIHEPTGIMHVQETADDDSTSSTILVSSGVKRPFTGAQPKRHVHFADEVTFIASQYEDKRECRQGWYSPKQYKLFRAATLEAAQQILSTERRNRAPHGYDRVMTRTFEYCKSAPDVVKDTCLPANDFLHLQRWMEVASSRIGLEKWAVRSVSAEKTIRRTALLECVRQSSSAEQLGLACVRVSRPSVLYARSLAQAQAAVVNKESFFHV